LFAALALISTASIIFAMPRLILKYSFVLFLLLGLFKFLEYQFFSYKIQLNTYLFLVATAFLIIGAFASWVVKPKDRIIVEREPEIDEALLATFSPREQDMIAYLSNGYTNKEIAQSLDISPNTVKSHLSKLFEKLQVSNRSHAIAEAKLLNLLK
jgi:DNA-binding CsgD family transcriptional regulator